MRLNFNFQGSEDIYYLLVHVGRVKMFGTEKHEIEVFFHRTDNDGRKLSQETIRKFVNIHQAAHLITGSIWDSNNKMIKPFRLNNTRINLQLQKGQLLKSRPLDKILYNIKYIPDFLFSRGSINSAGLIASKNRYLEIIQNDCTIVIPVWEILRKFYYFKKNLISLFFAGIRAESLMQAQSLPSNENDYELKAILTSNKFIIPEQFILGQLILHQDLSTSIQLTHSQLKKYFRLESENGNKKPKEILGYLFHDFYIPEDFLMQCNGFYFNYFDKKVFYVTTVCDVNNFFSFEKLSVAITPDTRPNSTNEDNLNTLIPQSTKFNINFQEKENTVLDSNQDGKSTPNTIELSFQSFEGFSFPKYERDDKIYQENKYKQSVQKFIQSSAAILSTFGGGNDSNILKADFSPERVQTDIASLFSDVYWGFEKAFLLSKVKLKSLNTDNDTGFTIYKNDETRTSYKLGIIEINYRNGYFYYIQSMHKGRGCLVCSHRALSNSNFFELFDMAHDENWNWSDLTENGDLKYMLQLVRSFGFQIKLKTRNHSSPETIVELCKKDIYQFLNL